MAYVIDVTVTNFTPREQSLAQDWFARIAASRAQQGLPPLSNIVEYLEWFLREHIDANLGSLDSASNADVRDAYKAADDPTRADVQQVLRDAGYLP